MYDYSSLLRLMAEKNISIRELSRKTSIPLSTLHDKLSGRTEFKVSEMIAVGKAVDSTDYRTLFFCFEGSK